MALLTHQQHPGFSLLGHHRHRGNQRAGLKPPGLEVHVGGHADPELRGGIHQLELHLKGGHVVRLHGPGSDLADAGGEAAVGEGIHPHTGGHAQPQAAEIAFGNLGQHLQALGELHDRGAGGTGAGRRGGGGGHEGARIGEALADHPVEGSPHDQFLLFHVALLQPLPCRIHRHPLHLFIGAETVEVVEADRSLAIEGFIAPQLTGAALQLGFGGADVGRQLLRPIAQVSGIHAGNGLAGLHRVALVHKELLDQALPFRAHIHPLHRIQFTGGGHHPRQLAGLGQHRVRSHIAAARLLLALPEAQAGEQGGHHGQQQPGAPAPPGSPASRQGDRGRRR